MLTEQSKSIPVEKGIPLLGVLPKFLGGDPFEYLRSVMLERGDFVQLNIGLQPIYLVSHPDYIQYILRDNYRNYTKPGILYDALRTVAGNGLGTSEGDLWLRQRRMIQPYLHRKALVNIFSDMVDGISEGLNHWKSLTENGTVVDFGEKIAEITAFVTSCTIFGKETLPMNDVAAISRYVADISHYVGTTFYSTALPSWFPIPGKPKFNRDLKAVREIIHLVIARSHQQKEHLPGLINMLIDAIDEESHEQMTEQQLFDEVMTIFIAGYETTASTLTWVSVILNNNPEILAKLQLEIDQVLGKRTPSFEDMPRLVYAKQVFMETLRMRAVSPFLPRALKAPDTIGNYHLPANAMVLLFFHGVHHNPHVWDQPEVFNPERFTPELIAERHPFAYLPFSAGPRKCIGDEFALLEGTLVIVMMLQKYNIQILPNQSFPGKLGISMTPKNGVKVTISAKSSV